MYSVGVIAKQESKSKNSGKIVIDLLDRMVPDNMILGELVACSGTRYDDIQVAIISLLADP
jgi:hypothetical protein